jgi:hypothetical protein
MKGEWNRQDAEDAKVLADGHCDGGSGLERAKLQTPTSKLQRNSKLQTSTIVVPLPVVSGGFLKK